MLSFSAPFFPAKKWQIMETKTEVPYKANPKKWTIEKNFKHWLIFWGQNFFRIFVGKKQKVGLPVLSVEKTSKALQSHMLENSTFLGAALQEWTNTTLFNENVGVGTRINKYSQWVFLASKNFVDLYCLLNTNMSSFLGVTSCIYISILKQQTKLHICIQYTHIILHCIILLHMHVYQNCYDIYYV